MDFVGFPKIARWSRNCIVTEKIDGTNAQIYIAENSEPIVTSINDLGHKITIPFLVGSRTRWITPKDDNFGFAKWAYDNAEELLKLGPGHHFGEWWGQGIQRNYGLREKRFSLFNVVRWSDDVVRPACCSVVPTLYYGPFPIDAEAWIEYLRREGSRAVPGYMNPEGIVIHHVQSRYSFKKTLDNDEKWKGE